MSSLAEAEPLTQSQPPITRTTHTLPFDKIAPRDFERLCLWLVEREGYTSALNTWAQRAANKAATSSLAVVLRPSAVIRNSET